MNLLFYRCFTLKNNEWGPSANMTSDRVYAAAAQLQDGRLFVTGGDSGSGYLNTSEILTEEGWQSNTPPLPFTMINHCMVAINSTTVMVIGGFHGKGCSGKTFYFTFGNENWTAGPAMKQNCRYDHSCGRIKKGTIQII